LALSTVNSLTPAAKFFAGCFDSGTAFSLEISC